MAQLGDEGLAELIAREQRGFRRILAGGVATLLVMAVISALLGAYLYVASERLAETTRTLQRQAFDTRRSVDAQNNRIAAQEQALRRAYDEIRRTGGGDDVAATVQNLEAAREVARSFLLRGRIPSLDEQRALAQLGRNGAGAPPRETAALLSGVYLLVGYETRGDQIADTATELPADLREAFSAFAAARRDPALAALANAGAAWILFEDASSGRRNYSRESCLQVFEAVAASVREEAPNPQPLYWRAQCERKLGLTSEALGDYARALRASAEAAEGGASRDAAELTLAMNAFHGVGTTLIAGAAIPDDAPGMREALAIAGEACPGAGGYPQRSARMALALACLDEAIALRRALGQTANQLSGSGENISFAHLRDGDIEAAYLNAAAIERTGIFPWNEVVRALTAPRARLDDGAARRAAAAAAIDARRNVAMFRVSQFNICELEALFDPAMFEDAQALIAETHPGEDVGCATAG